MIYVRPFFACLSTVHTYCVHLLVILANVIEMCRVGEPDLPDCWLGSV
jgi:hypothetical protein